VSFVFQALLIQLLYYYYTTGGIHADIFHRVEMEPKKIPILFFVNKIDLPDVLKPADVSQSLGLEKIRNKAWQIW
jgi:hypothetical protein